MEALTTEVVEVFRLNMPFTEYFGDLERELNKELKKYGYFIGDTGTDFLTRDIGICKKDSEASKVKKLILKFMKNRVKAVVLNNQEYITTKEKFNGQEEKFNG